MVLLLPDVGFRAKIHRGVVQDLQRFELGSIVLFRHPQPQLSEYALVGVVGRARWLVSGTLEEVHRVLLRAGKHSLSEDLVVKHAKFNIRSSLFALRNIVRTTSASI